MPEIGSHIPLYWRPVTGTAPVEYLLWDTPSDPILWNGATDYILWV